MRLTGLRPGHATFTSLPLFVNPEGTALRATRPGTKSIDFPSKDPSGVQTSITTRALRRSGRDPEQDELRDAGARVPDRAVGRLVPIRLSQVIL